MDHERVRAIFRGALELDPAARDRYVRDACAGSPHLYAEVAGLLRAAAADTDALRPDASVLEPEAPELDGYAVEDEIGRGGMGTVYRGRDRRTGHRVAIKVLHPWLHESVRTLERFRREAAAGMRVRHKNIARTLALGTTADGRQALVMEYVEGRTLRTLLADLGTVPESLLREIARQVAAGLEAIHDAGIVHRDIKPENILLSDDQRVCVTDLGVAKLVADSIDLTREGQFLGSLAYAAPEQLEGGPLTPAADLYALGVLLYELAAGANLYRHDEARATIQAHREVPPPPLHLVEPRVSQFFSQLVATLAAKDPRARFGSAGQLRAVLQHGERSAWWSDRAGRHAEPAPAPAPPRRERAFVGRARQWAALDECWGRARRGDGGVVAVTGEAGSGKTRLLREWTARFAREDVRCIHGSFPPEGGLRGLLEGLEDLVLPRYLESRGLRDALAARMRGDTAAAEAGPDALAAALVRLVRAVARERPLVWVIDDVHFASAEARAVLRSLGRGVRGRRALLVVTSRTPVRAPAPAEIVPLPRLDRIAVHDLLTQEFGDAALADQFAEMTLARSDGVPFFVLQIVRALVEQGIVRRDENGCFRRGAHPREFRMPASVREIVAARLESLDEPERRLLDAAAVAGYVFDPEVVADVVQSSVIGTLQTLARLERAFAVVRSQGRLFRFEHHVVHESLYDAVPQRLREELHARVAVGLERRAEVERDPVAIVLHHLRGSRPQRSVPLLSRALQAAEGRPDAGMEICRRALAVDGLLTGAPRAEAQFWMADYAGRFGLPAERDAAVREAREIAEDVADDALHARALNAIFRARAFRTSDTSHVELLRDALARARRAGDAETEAQVALNLAMALTWVSEDDEAHELCERARAGYRALGRPDGEARALTRRATLERRRNDIEASLRTCEQAARIAEAAGSVSEEAFARGNMAKTLREIGRFEEARERLRRQRALLAKCGDFRLEMLTIASLAEVETETGRFESALAVFRNALDLTELAGDMRTYVTTVCCCCLIERFLGRLDAADEYLRRAYRVRRASRIRTLSYETLSQRTQMAHARGDTGRAIRLARRGIAVTAATGDRRQYANAHLALAWILRDAGRTAEAREALLRGREIPGLSEAARTKFAVYLAETPAEFDAARRRLARVEALFDRRVLLKLRFALFEGAGEADDLVQARRIAQDLRRHAPAECRDTMVDRNPLLRKLEDAWEALR